MERSKALAARWSELAGKAKAREEITCRELAAIFQQSVAAVRALQDPDTAPRSLLQAMWLIDEFTYYATLFDENYLEGLHPLLYRFNHSLKNLFFKGHYQSHFFCGEADAEEQEFLQTLEQLGEHDFARFLESQSQTEVSL